jgi:hypothetical protein
VADIYNLNPYFYARQMAHQLLARQGADFFTLSESDAPAFRLDPHKVEWVVNSALDAARKAAPNLTTSANDLHLCRTKLENELLRRFVASHVFSQR